VGVGELLDPTPPIVDELGNQRKGETTVPEAHFEIATIVDPMFAENCYVVYQSGQSDCVVVDPGLDPAAILRFLNEHQLAPAAILCTHGHLDHVAGNGMLKDRWPDCPIVIGDGDAYKLTDPTGNLSGGYGTPMVSPPADQTLREGDTFEAAGLRFEVLETPGHSRGHIVFVDRQSNPVRVFGGDVLFQRGIGRYDFPDASFEELLASIHDKLFPLPDETIVLPGHGPPTTIGEERQENPFVGAAAGYDV
jgi:glyoxylase-like metal-dependent hydrolase (beta-lactamase superfamily II)